MNAFWNDVQLAGEALWKVLLASLVLGAGLPAIFALGVRALAWGAGGDADVGAVAPPAHRSGKPLAVVCFVLVAYGIVCALLFIIASGQGKTLDFSTIIPTFSAAG